MIQRNPTRRVRIGSIVVGGGEPVAVQSMCATPTREVAATAAQAEALREAGAGVVRVAVDSRRDAEALAEVRKRTTANLAVDLQESYRLAGSVAPQVDKIRYNPGHLYHHETSRSPGQPTRSAILADSRRRERLRDPRRRELRIGRSGAPAEKLRRRRFRSRR